MQALRLADRAVVRTLIDFKADPTKVRFNHLVPTGCGPGTLMSSHSAVSFGAEMQPADAAAAEDAARQADD